MERSRARAGGAQPHNPAAIGIHRTGTAEARAPGRARLDRRAWENLGAVGLAWFLVIAIGFTGWFVVVVPLRADFLGNDLTLVYSAARIGLEHGWSHIYSLPLQHEAFSKLHPHAVWHSGGWFLATPPFAWLLAPFVPLGPDTAVAVWLGIAIVSLVAAWWIAAPGAGWGRGLWLLAALAWYPVLYALSLVQPDFAVILVVVAAWRLAEKQRPYLAGALLGLTAIKPQLVLLLPVVLLTSGRWRIVVPAAAVVGALAALSFLSLGPGGLADYRSILSQGQQVANNRYFTPAYVLGPGAAGYIFAGVVAVLAAVAGYLNRRSTDARVFALGLVATTIGATYWHLQDFSVLVVAAWLFWRDATPAWQRWWLLAVVVTAEFAWGLTPLPVLVAVAVWFAFLIAPPRAQQATA